MSLTVWDYLNVMQQSSALFSLHHDHFTIVDIEALGRLVDSDAAQGVPLTILALGITLDSLDVCCSSLEGHGNRH